MRTEAEIKDKITALDEELSLRRGGMIKEEYDILSAFRVALLWCLEGDMDKRFSQIMPAAKYISE